MSSPETVEIINPQMSVFLTVHQNSTPYNGTNPNSDTASAKCHHYVSNFP